MAWTRLAYSKLQERLERALAGATAPALLGLNFLLNWAKFRLTLFRSTRTLQGGKPLRDRVQ